jgi:hypothetical protein
MPLDFPRDQVAVEPFCINVYAVASWTCGTFGTGPLGGWRYLPF